MKSVIFDFDGVFGNTLDSITEFLSKVSFQPKDRVRRELLNTMMLNYQENFFQRLLKDTLARPMGKHLLKQKDLIFIDRLLEIQDLKVPKAILSNNYSFICKSLLGSYAKVFDVIVGDSEADTKIKGFETIFKISGFSADNSIFVTDSVGDILEAQKVLDPNQIYGVSWGYHTTEVLNRYLPAEHVLSDFKNLEKILKRKTKANNQVALKVLL